MSTPYHEAYNQLNAKQKQAVELIYGPVMVIAGPGTGKTQLLSTRVGYILENTDYRPFNILCITYTNSGVAAMKKRLVELIGSAGHDVEVYTFHSFAEKVIQRYRQSNALDDFIFLDDLDKKIIIRELLDKIDFNTPLKKGVTSVDATIHFLTAFFNQIKKEKYDVDELIQSYEEEKVIKKDAEEFQYKRATGNKKKGDLKEKEWNDFINKLDKHIQSCLLYKEYQRVILEKKWIDFDDLILQAIQILQEDEDLRYDFQEQYQIIMIDEFQDTNGAQLEIVHELCRDNEDPNVMVVGDEDQSIFRFQGANIYNIHDFHHRYLSHRTIDEQLERIVVLQENYRSTPMILESSRLLIEHNTERITHLVEGRTIYKKLISSNKHLKDVTHPIEFIDVENKQDLHLPIALEINTLVQNGAALKDIAVLFPSNQLSNDFSDYLKILNYPFELSKEEDILQDEMILSLLQVYRLIRHFSLKKTIDKGDIGSFLMYPWLGLSLHDIATFWVEIKEVNPENFLAYLLDLESLPSIKTIFSYVEECIKMQSVLPPQRFFHYVLDKFYIKEWAIKQPNRLDILQKIEVLEHFLTDYLQKIESKNFFDFLDRIDAYQREQVPINYSKHIQSDQSIKLMTYHKSKGLEFEYVFVYGAGRYPQMNQNKLYLPERILSKDMHAEKESIIVEEEKRRLLYVAMTRAKRKLYLVDVLEEKADGTSKNKFKSELPIVSEEMYRMTPDIQALILSKTYQISEADYLQFQAVNQTNLDIKDEQIYENQYTENRIKNFQLSHSSINAYLECPQKFYFEKIISIPSETSYAMTAGNFYHAVLEEYFNRIQLDSSQKTLEVLLNIARVEIYRYKNFITEFEFKDIQKAIETNLPILFDQYLSTINHNQFGVEDNFEMKIGTATVTGKLDRWDSINNELFISDFKTGKKSNAKKKQSLTPYGQTKIKDEKNRTVDEVYGGNYWRQAVLYHMLAKHNFPNQEVKEAKFIFIIPEDNKIESESFSPNVESENYMKNLILMVHDKIQNKEFEGCKKLDCSWCQEIAWRQYHAD